MAGPPPPPTTPPGAPAEPNPTATSSQLQSLPPLQQLVAPIALDPDPLLALMLPAAAHSDQIQAVASNPAGADDPSFDSSVQGLAHYPDILNWMAANPAWTQELGNAFASSPADIMAAVQSLRQQARNAGTLTPSNYEQVIVDQDGQIEILPTQPAAISVPTYDPSVVYWAPQPGYDSPFFTWSEPYPVGAWLTFDFDWHQHALWSGDWYSYREAHGGWNHPIDFAHVNVSAAIGRGHQWQAPNNRQAAYRGPAYQAQGARPYEQGARPNESEPRDRPALTEQQRAEQRAPANYAQQRPAAEPNGRPGYPATTRAPAPVYHTPTQRPPASRPAPRPAPAPRPQPERRPEER